MSIFALGMNDVSENMQAAKDKLASKDAQIAAQQGQLMKKAGEMDEMKQALDDALQKLNNETSRVLQLENSLNKVTTDLQNSSLNAQNTSAALASTEERLRLKDLEAKELENTLVSLSRDLEGQQSQIKKIEQEKWRSEGRVKELESAVKVTVISPAPPRSSARSRSSSLSNPRITMLQDELAELRATLASRDTELQTIQSKLEVAQRDALKADNNQMASEARVKGRVAEMERLIAEREEELQCLRENGGIGGLQREEELLKRIDEAWLKEKLKKCEEMLKSELSRVGELESRNVELVQEKEEALDELEDARGVIAELETRTRTLSSEIQNLKSKSSPISDLDEENVTHMERLLGAVERLRAERDSLRRDMEFLDMESKFAIAGLEAKVASLSSTPASYPPFEVDPDENIPLICVTPCADEKSISDSALITTTQRHRKEVARLRRLLLGCSLVIGHLETERADVQAQRDSAYIACAETANGVVLTEGRLLEAESKVTTTIQLLEETTAQRNDAMSRLSALDTEWRMKLDSANADQHESRLAVDHLNAQLDDISKMLETVTSERDSLNVQVTNLNSDITSARQELTEAESRYTQLQFHQLSDMPSTQATKALRSQIEELEDRILRRTEQIGIHQHDVRRLETNMRLQEERLVEMTTEMEMIVAQKDAMVEDCADAREQRDEARLNVERLEEEVERLESLLEDRNREQEVIIEVMFLNSARTKEKMGVETGKIEQMRARMKSLLEEHDNTLHNVQTLNDALEDAKQRLQSSEQDAKRAADSLRSSQAELTRSLMSTQDLEEVKIDLSGRVRLLEDQLQSRVAEVGTLAFQLESLQQETSTTIQQRSKTIEGLQSQLDIARSLLSEKESEYHVALEDLRQQIIQKDQFLANSEFEGELVQLKMKHIEELGLLQSHLVQVTTTLDELKARHDSAQVEHEQSMADSAHSKAQVEQQLQETARELSRIKEVKEGLEAASHKHSGEIRQLQGRVASSDSELTLARERLDNSDTSLQQKVEELATTRKQYEELLTEERNTLAVTRTRLDEESAAAIEFREQASALQRKLDEEVQGRSQDRTSYEERLHDAKECQGQAESRVEELGQHISMLETQIQDMTAQIEVFQEDQNDARKSVTALEASVQRSLSMNCHLESQVRERYATLFVPESCTDPT
ncbi:hypothetical protein F5050DRAFT_491864 [Lentinula boryana]|uniref:Uncharacterized protein n=1 Tax=Lentinula boryana TaxID=40481 RepID=A0ABQ8QVB7_9AGAR|nr:hypothetical protein F5050DRAFT_491864 [Lentinula boryana]